MTGELLMLIIAGIVAWGVALVTYLPTIKLRQHDHDTTMAAKDYDDAA